MVLGTGPLTRRWSFGKGAIIDDRARRYDRRGRLVDVSTDRFCSFLCIGTSVPEARELARLHRLHAMLVLGGENHALTHQVSEIIGGGISLNVSIQQAKIIRSVLDYTYQALGLPKDNLELYCHRNYPVKAAKFKKEMARRKQHAAYNNKDNNNSSDESDDDDTPPPLIPESADDASVACGVAMQDAIRRIIINAGGAGDSAPRAFSIHTPNPVEKKRPRNGAGAAMDVDQSGAGSGASGSGLSGVASSGMAASGSGASGSGASNPVPGTSNPVSGAPIPVSGASVPVPSPVS